MIMFRHLTAASFMPRFWPVIFLILFTTTWSCKPTDRSAFIVNLTGETMGTTYSVKLSDIPSDQSREVIQQEIDRLLEQVNDQMSTWRSGSELSRFNGSESTDWFEVSADTAFVVDAALQVSKDTEGAFDITVGPMVNLWHFGPDSPTQQSQLPSEQTILETRSRVGFDKIAARQEPPALKKSHATMEIDLSAIAKGYGVDVVAKYLGELGISSFLVEIGGEMRAQGTRPDGTNWKVGIEKPIARQRTLQQSADLNNRSIATSGNYRNFFEIDGVRYSHTIDPRTGHPVTHSLASVSVVMESCMMADAWATALLVLGPDTGYNIAKEQNLAVLFLIETDKGFQPKSTPAFDKIIQVAATNGR